MAMHVQRIDSGLQPRVLGLARQQQGATRVLVLLGDGGATVNSGADEHALAGPALFWLARPDNCRLRIDAGSTGYVAEIADDTLARAVGDFAESAALMFMVDRDLALSFNGGGGTMGRIGDALAAVLEETKRPQNGGAMMIAAQLRILLVLMLRETGLEEVAGRGRGEDARFLQRFRQLVEGNFREHLPVRRYAEMLSISHDRLHAICKRELGKTPKALVAERLAREAGLALERSTLSIEQLSYTLGFRDPAHFSHFFKRMTGLAPGRFREMSTASAPEGFSPPSFSDWP